MAELSQIPHLSFFLKIPANYQASSQSALRSSKDFWNKRPNVLKSLPLLLVYTA